MDRQASMTHSRLERAGVARSSSIESRQQRVSSRKHQETERLQLNQWKQKRENKTNAPNGSTHKYREASDPSPAAILRSSFIDREHLVPRIFGISRFGSFLVFR